MKPGSLQKNDKVKNLDNGKEYTVTDVKGDYITLEHAVILTYSELARHNYVKVETIAPGWVSLPSKFRLIPS